MLRNRVLFVVVAIVAVGSLFALFKLRYGWYTTDAQASFLNIGFVICLFAIGTLWFFYPTRIGIAAIGVAAIVFPWVMQPKNFVAIDLPFLAYASVPILLLVLATQLKRNETKKQSEDT